jgi:hydroxymethylglutaryl-CoA lyase
MAFGVATSDVFSRKNTRNSAREALETCRRLVHRAHRDGVRTRVYLMTAWVCPFTGPTPPERALGFAQEIWEMEIDELAIADTIGYANPLEVGRLCESIGRRTAMEQLAVHLHDTQALGLANTTTAISAGVRTFDSSVGGLGGCPFAPGAAGNLATEDLVFLAYKMGMGSGIDLQKLWDIVHHMEDLLDRPLGGRIRAWWESNADVTPELAQP